MVGDGGAAVVGGCGPGGGELGVAGGEQDAGGGVGCDAGGRGDCCRGGTGAGCVDRGDPYVVGGAVGKAGDGGGGGGGDPVGEGGPGARRRGAVLDEVVGDRRAAVGRRCGPVHRERSGTGGGDPGDAVAAVLDHVQRPCAVSCERSRAVEHRSGGRAGGGAGGGSRECRHEGGRVGLADPVVVLVRDEQVSSGIEQQPVRVVEGRGDSGAVGGAGRARSSEGGDHCGGGDAPDAVAEDLGDEEVAGAVDRQALWAGEGRRGAGAVGASGAAGSGEGGDDAGGGDAADLVVGPIGNEQVAGRVEGQAHRLVERRGGSGCVGRTGAAGSGEHRHRATGGDAGDPVAVELGDVEVAGGVERQPIRAGKATGEGGDDAGGGDAADPVVGVVGDVQVAGAVERTVEGPVEARRGAGGVGAARRPGSGEHAHAQAARKRPGRRRGGGDGGGGGRGCAGGAGAGGGDGGDAEVVGGSVGEAGDGECGGAGGGGPLGVASLGGARGVGVRGDVVAGDGGAAGGGGWGPVDGDLAVAGGGGGDGGRGGGGGGGGSGRRVAVGVVGGQGGLGAPLVGQVALQDLAVGGGERSSGGNDLAEGAVPILAHSCLAATDSESGPTRDVAGSASGHGLRGSVQPDVVPGAGNVLVGHDPACGGEPAERRRRELVVAPDVRTIGAQVVRATPVDPLRRGDQGRAPFGQHNAAVGTTSAGVEDVERTRVGAGSGEAVRGVAQPPVSVQRECVASAECGECGLASRSCLGDGAVVAGFVGPSGDVAA